MQHETKKLISTVEQLIETIGTNLIADGLIAKLRGEKSLLELAEQNTNKFRDMVHGLIGLYNAMAGRKIVKFTEFYNLRVLNTYTICISLDGVDAFIQEVFCEDGLRIECSISEMMYYNILRDCFFEGISNNSRYSDR